jgi:hypothetical protein
VSLKKVKSTGDRRSQSRDRRARRRGVELWKESQEEARHSRKDLRLHTGDLKCSYETPRCKIKELRAKGALPPNPINRNEHFRRDRQSVRRREDLL